MVIDKLNLQIHKKDHLAKESWDNFRKSWGFFPDGLNDIVKSNNYFGMHCAPIISIKHKIKARREVELQIDIKFMAGGLSIDYLIHGSREVSHLM